jgi:hypothetical protein
MEVVIQEYVHRQVYVLRLRQSFVRTHFGPAADVVAVLQTHSKLTATIVPRLQVIMSTARQDRHIMAAAVLDGLAAVASHVWL